MPAPKYNILTPSIAFLDLPIPPKPPMEDEIIDEEYYNGEEEDLNVEAFLPDKTVMSFVENLQKPENNLGFISSAKETKYIGVYSSVSTRVEGDHPTHRESLVKDLLRTKARKSLSATFVTKKKDIRHKHVFRDHFIDPCGIISPHTAFGSLTVNDASNNIQFMTQLIKRFHKAYCRRAFVHWGVGEGTEESEYIYSADTVETKIQDYKDC